LQDTDEDVVMKILWVAFVFWVWLVRCHGLGIY